jgi:hypothetical protein
MAIAFRPSPTPQGTFPDEILPPVRKAFNLAVDWAAMGSNEPLTVPELEPVEG